jgi:hypothetical protein
MTTKMPAANAVTALSTRLVTMDGSCSPEGIDVA